MKLEVALQSVAIVQLAIAILNLFLVRLLDWKSEVERMPLLLREVFQVHAWFITVTLVIFGVMTLKFSREFSNGSNEMARWLAAGIGSFWAIRTILQVTYYSSSHWRGRLDRTAIHIALLFVYGGVAAVYGWAAIS